MLSWSKKGNYCQSELWIFCPALHVSHYKSLLLIIQTNLYMFTVILHIACTPTTYITVVFLCCMSSLPPTYIIHPTWSVQLLTYKGNNAERSSASSIMPRYYTQDMYNTAAHAFRRGGQSDGRAIVTPQNEAQLPRFQSAGGETASRGFRECEV